MEQFECTFPACTCIKWCAVKIGKRVPDREPQKKE